MAAEPRDKFLADYLASDEPEQEVLEVIERTECIANREGLLFRPQDLYSPESPALLDLVHSKFLPNMCFASCPKASFLTTKSSVQKPKCYPLHCTVS